jgi:radical SAM enzyme (rSAM/lipoprotein system)
MLSAIKRAAFRQFKKLETDVHELNYLFWECTTRCNLRCRHCGSDCSQSSRYADMPLSDFVQAIETIKHTAKNFTVVLTGGEPLLRSDIELCGREIRKRGMHWSLVSNGMLYDRNKHNALLNAGLGALTISIDGMEDNHNWLRGSTSSFDRVVDAIALAASEPRLNFDVVTCVNTRNIAELSTIKQLLIQKGVKHWRLFTIVPIGRAKDDAELMLSAEQFVALMEFICDARKSKDIDVKFSCEGYVGRYEAKVRDTPFFCRAGINIGSVLADGSISACPNIDRSFAQGNIYSDNFYDVWNTRFQPFRNRNWTRTGRCADCKAFKDCLGNGLHNRQGDVADVLVCHLERTLPKIRLFPTPHNADSVVLAHND